VGFFDRLFGDRKRKAEQRELTSELDHWRIAKIAGADGTLVIARVRLQRPNLPNLAKYTTAVSISWPLVDDSTPPKQTPEMDQFEISMADFERTSYLIQVRTGLGEKNWLYYSCEADALLSAIRSRIVSHGWPISVQAKEDPTWSEWRQFAERIKNEMH
jgi:hypothetical protein